MVKKKKPHTYKRRNVVSARGGPAFGWDFRVRARYFFFAIVFIVAAVFLLNPKPADITFDNIYRKLTHILLHEESEYVKDEYINDILAQDGTFKKDSILAVFNNSPAKTFSQPPSIQFLTTVLPAATQLAQGNDSKWIEVDLSEQKLYAWENGEKKFEFLMSSGMPWTPTVTGDYRIWIKLRFANMKGGSKEMGDYYYLPNVPYVMYFYKGYGLHGTYWHNNFGTPMSHGCVNLRTEDAGKIFEWVGPDMQGKSVILATSENPGTRVVVHE